MLDISNNDSLITFNCSSNQITTINIGIKILLSAFNCSNNQIGEINFVNVDKTNINTFNTINNPNLYCIEVEDESWSTALWTDIDTWSSFSEDCNYTSIEEYQTETKLLKIVDVLGRETKPATNTPLFYIYENGLVEKRIIIE